MSLREIFRRRKQRYTPPAEPLLPGYDPMGSNYWIHTDRLPDGDRVVAKGRVRAADVLRWQDQRQAATVDRPLMTPLAEQRTRRSA